ncbi:unnamed protein product [Strongylus vulgaris]|uniref:Uncharacterized protein n=1 Tax=Strongylus vulgaris TaxID=40348 RepID=A0A3P7K1F8_STRVU|nr:unnamed protein product [Strongylus vulgaris]
MLVLILEPRQVIIGLSVSKDLRMIWQTTTISPVCTSGERESA